MRDLSLHVLDLLENSARAGAHVIAVRVALERAADRLTLTVEDDGPGLAIPPEQALSPFCSTKAGHRTGLGLPLFRASAEQAGGDLTLGRSPLGGLQVQATLRWSHVDRLPLGDLAASVAAIAATHPEIDVRCRIAADAQERPVSTAAVAEALPPALRGGFSAVLQVAAAIRSAMEELGLPSQ